MTTSEPSDRVRLAAIVDSSDDAIVSKTLDGIITSWNRGAEQMFGFTASETVGRHISVIIPEDRLAEEEGVLARLRRGEKVDHFETVRRTKDGRLVDISLTVSPVRDDDGRIVGASKVARDITQRRKLEQELRDANAAKDEFLATLSHELRTPLNAMLGWTHLLRSGELPKDMQVRALDALERNGRAQAQLVDDLLDVSRIVSGRLQIRADDVDLGTVIGTAVDTVRPAAAAKALDLHVRLPESQVNVRGDADRLRQVFWNLLSNAVKFTPVRGRIDVELQVADDTADVVVRDNGLGIQREFLSHVFERFRQADNSHARRYGGLGLGLAIVRNLVEAHGGSVAVASDGEGRGSTFTVRLSAQSVRSSIRVADAPQPQRGTTLAGLQILVVDDERDAREFLGAFLAMHGAGVELAASAGEALGKLANRRVDVLLADLGLPDSDGYALIQAIRSLAPEQGGSVPAVAVTAYAGLRERAKAFECGYGWHVAKPIDPDQLLTVVSTAVRSRNRPGPVVEVQPLEPMT